MCSACAASPLRVKAMMNSEASVTSRSDISGDYRAGSCSCIGRRSGRPRPS
jgi:hypothetical protein